MLLTLWFFLSWLLLSAFNFQFLATFIILVTIVSFALPDWVSNIQEGLSDDGQLFSKIFILKLVKTKLTLHNLSSRPHPSHKQFIKIINFCSKAMSSNPIKNFSLTETSALTATALLQNSWTVIWTWTYRLIYHQLTQLGRIKIVYFYGQPINTL